jgi:hypothetical protein
MRGERLACDPEKWSSATWEEIAADTVHYGAEHGFSPEQLEKEGIFLIGYQYLINFDNRTIFPINPVTRRPYTKDAREMFRLGGFNRLVDQLLDSPPGTFFLWVSPADPELNYPYPRIYLGQVEPQPSNDADGFLVQAIDFNNDFSQEELAAVLNYFDPRLTFANLKDFRRQPVVIPPTDQLNQIAHLLDRIEAVVSQQRGGEAVLVHGVPFAAIKQQLNTRVWEKTVNKLRELAEKTADKVYPAIQAGNFSQAVLNVAQFELAVARQMGGSFAPVSSCGSAIGLFAEGTRQLGIPSWASFISPRPAGETSSRRCPVCGAHLSKPVAVGESCPYCGTVRRC